jgi:hypothetical protein
VAPGRQPHRGNVGWAERARPKNRHPPRVILFDPVAGRQEDAVPIEGIGARLSAGKSFLFGDFHAPTDAELDLLARELSPHPLWLIRRQGIR